MPTFESWMREDRLNQKSTRRPVPEDQPKKKSPKIPDDLVETVAVKIDKEIEILQKNVDPSVGLEREIQLLSHQISKLSKLLLLNVAVSGNNHGLMSRVSVLPGLK